MQANITLPPKLALPVLLSYDELEKSAPEGIYATNDSPDGRYLVFKYYGQRVLMFASQGQKAFRLSWGDSFRGELRERKQFFLTEEKLTVSFAK